MDLETKIRDLASQGYSLKAASKAIGVSSHKLKLMSDILGGISWSKPGSSAARRKLNPDAIAPIGHRRANGTDQQRCRPYDGMMTFRGVQGTLEALMGHFSVEWMPATVKRRLDAGMNIEDAFFSGRPKTRSWARRTHKSDFPQSGLISHN